MPLMSDKAGSTSDKANERRVTSEAIDVKYEIERERKTE